MQISTVTTPKGPIEYSSYGTGIPILMVHGGHSNCEETMTHKGLNTDQFQIITPSRPGYRNTPLESGQSATEQAHLFVALMDTLEIDRFVVMGISAGGLTAIEIAALYPMRVEKLVLASALSKKWFKKTDRLYKTAKRIFHPSVETMTWAMFRFFYPLMPALMAKVMIKDLSTVEQPSITKEEQQQLWEMVREQSSGSGFLNDIEQDIPSDSLEKIIAPTFIVHSKNDGSVPVAHALHAYRNIPGSDLLLVDNKWGHLIWVGAEFATIERKLNDFLLIIV